MTDLKKSFADFVEQRAKEIEPAKNATREFLIRHHEVISFAVPIAKSISDAIVGKSPTKLIEGVFAGAGVISGNLSHSPYYYLTSARGWKLLKTRDQTADILKIGLEGFPPFKMYFQYSEGGYRWFKTPVGEFSVANSGGWISHTHIYYRGDLSDEQVIDWLAEETLKTLPGHVYHLTMKWKAGETKITPYPTVSVPSADLDKYTSYIRKCFDLGINRSIMFHGPPGTGKTSLAHSIIHTLGLRTLIYESDGMEDMQGLFFFIKKFKIECVCLDDFDHGSNTNQRSILEVLERLNREVKLTIGLVNSMKEFHAAVLRPDRFDQFEVIDHMDDKVIQNELGDLAGEWLSKVRHWPIAFIQELVVRSKTYPIQELTKHYIELNKRVDMQLKEAGMKGGKYEEELQGVMGVILMAEAIRNQSQTKE